MSEKALTKQKLDYNKPPTSLVELKQSLVAQRQGIAENLPNWMEADIIINRIVRVAQSEPKIMNCTMKSITLAALFCSQIAMEPNTPEGHVYLIPYGDKLQVIMGYKGMVTLSHRSTAIQDIQTGTVYRGDEFEIIQGSNPTITHKRKFNDPRRDADIICSYAVFRLKNGGMQMRVTDKEEVQYLIDKAKPGSPWREHVAAMMEKTAVRRGMKLVPVESSSYAYNAMSRAIAVDEAMEAGQTIDDVIEGEIVDIGNQDERLLSEANNKLKETTGRSDTINNEIDGITLD